MGELEGTSEKVFEGTATVLAASVLTWMVFWMRRQSRTIGGHLRSQVGDAIATGNVLALTGVAFVAVAREGIETALFLFAATKESGAVATVIGGTAGVIVAIGLGVMFYRGAITIDLKKFFAVTGMLVILLAAYLLFIGVHEFAEASGGDALELLAPSPPSSTAWPSLISSCAACASRPRSRTPDLDPGSPRLGCGASSERRLVEPPPKLVHRLVHGQRAGAAKLVFAVAAGEHGQRP